MKKKEKKLNSKKRKVRKVESKEDWEDNWTARDYDLSRHIH